ncbi:hypothetical protein BH11BAC7_BH11BAC7_24300 [soil metagenome]
MIKVDNYSWYPNCILKFLTRPAKAFHVKIFRNAGFLQLLFADFCFLNSMNRINKKQINMKRSATAQWLGTGKEGSGTVSTQSQSLNKTQYSYKSRFEEGTGTNPEELIAAAHAGCFSMKLSFLIGAAGLTPGSIETTCDIVLDNGKITSSALATTVKAEGLTNDKLQEIAADAKENCPISKLLNTDISMTATLAV